jgi:hypothetical protein
LDSQDPPFAPTLEINFGKDKLASDVLGDLGPSDGAVTGEVPFAGDSLATHRVVVARGRGLELPSEVSFAGADLPILSERGPQLFLLSHSVTASPTGELRRPLRR